MNFTKDWRIRSAQVLLGVAIVFALVVVRGTNAGNEPAHLPTDWSHHHLVFSPPGNLGQHVHLLSNPRYVQQLVRRNAERLERQEDRDERRWRRAPEPNPNADSLHGDWSMDMGASAMAGPGVFPAKFSFNATTANCANVAAPAQPDFVVFNTSVAGVATAVAASATGTFTGFNQPANKLWTEVITDGANSVTLSASLTLNTGLNFEVGAGAGSNAQEAVNLANAINRNDSTVGVTAAAAGAVVTVTATTAGSAGNSIVIQEPTPAFKFSFTNSPSTNLAGGVDAQATIGAFDNLYSSCTGSVPTTYWAYNTGTAGAALNSTVLSGDGTQVAFTQNTATASTLVLLKWKANEGTFSAPTTLSNSASAAAYHTCVTTTSGPCMFTIPFSVANGGAAALDGNSSPFYDFSTDTLYVSNDNGYLHKFTGIFKGTPAEVVSTVGNLWPALMLLGQSFTSPVYVDGAGGFGAGVSGVFVADRNHRKLYRVDATIGGGTNGVVATGVLGSLGIDDSPLVDSSTGMVYVFVRGDNGAPGSTQRAGVYQFTASFAAGNLGAEVPVSSDDNLPNTTFWAGSFDNIYYSSGPGTGNMYVCGVVAGFPALWQIPVTAGILGTPVAGPTLASARRPCSPVTENESGGADWVFLSVTNNGIPNGVINCVAASGCIMSFDVTSGLVPTAASHTATARGGTSGIVVDGSSVTAGASQVYFTPGASQVCTTSGGTGGCAIQASQSGLN